MKTHNGKKELKIHAFSNMKAAVNKASNNVGAYASSLFSGALYVCGDKKLCLTTDGKVINTETGEEVEEKSILRSVRRMYKEDEDRAKACKDLASVMACCKTEEEALLMHMCYKNRISDPLIVEKDDELYRVWPVGHNATHRFFAGAKVINGEEQRFVFSIYEDYDYPKIGDKYVDQSFTFRKTWGYLGHY